MHFMERLCSSGKDWASLWFMHYVVSEHGGFCAIYGLSGFGMPFMSVQFTASRLDSIP